MNRTVLRGFINKKLNMEELLYKQFGVRAYPGYTMLCPFHKDSRKSAKFYPDNAIYCFTESKMYRPYDVLVFCGMTDEQIVATYGCDFNFKPEKRIMYKGIDILRVRLQNDFTIEKVVQGWLSLEVEAEPAVEKDLLQR